MFICILYMFRAAMCPSPGTLLYQSDTWFMSPRAGDRLLSRWPAYQTVTCTNSTSSWLFTRIM